jgi:DNA invertase Pin-like site-specific DNA recombinase
VTRVVWTVSLQEFNEVEDETRPKSVEAQLRRRRAIAKYIIESGASTREAASVFGINQSNVYRALAGLMGSPYSDVQDIWLANKLRSRLMVCARAGKARQRALKKGR